MRTEIPIVVVNAAGTPVVNASVAIYLRGSSLNLAAIYQHATGPDTFPNPVHTDAAGRVAGWIERGQYDCVISAPGLATFTEPYDSAPAGDGGIDTNWIADGAVTVSKIAPSTLAGLGGSGSWREPVATADELPLEGNDPGDVRLSLADMALNAWDGTQWVLAAGAGGGGGGGGGGTALPINVFVQKTQPDVSVLLQDSLWIPLWNDGTPKGVSAWQVYTGTGSGDGGNAFVQQTLPTPTVDSLWVALNSDDTPKYIDQWEVLTGYGQQDPRVGNENLFIQTALPSAPPLGTLFLPLNTDQSPKPIDQWRVYT